MSKKIVRKVIAVTGGAIALFYIALLIANAGKNEMINTEDSSAERIGTVAIFGATGTIGDGLLKAAMNDPDVEKIHVVTRRPSLRIEEGVASGAVEMTKHLDYTDYSDLSAVLSEADTVLWAIGLSAVGLDEDTYREIHTTYPTEFVASWQSVNQNEGLSFHYVSGSGASADSRMMWAREKAAAETALKNLAENSHIRVVSYRPSFIMPTEMEANFGHRLMHAILAPINAINRAESIGNAMLEVTARGEAIPNGTILESKDIIGLGAAYERQNDQNGEN